MGNKYKETAFCTTSSTWSLGPSYKGTASLPRNLKKNKIHNYNDAYNNGLTPQYNEFCTLRKKKNNQSLSNDADIQDNSDDKSLILILRITRTPTLNLCVDRINSSQKNKKTTEVHFANWEVTSWNDDPTCKLKAYISGNNITTFCINLSCLIDYKKDYKKVLKPLFKDVVSTSPTINKLCININPIVEKELPPKDLKKLLSRATRELHKSGGEYWKNIYIGSSINKYVDPETTNKIFEVMDKLNKQKQLESKTHCIRVITVAGPNYITKLYNEHKQKYSPKIPITALNFDSDNTNTTYTITFCPQTFSPKQSISKQTCHKITNNKYACTEGDTNVSVSTTDDYDSGYNSAALGNTHPSVDDTHIYESL